MSQICLDFNGLYSSSDNMAIIGMVGSSEEHWSSNQKRKAKQFMENLFLWEIQKYKLAMSLAMPIGTSGHCAYGGVDIWMEEICDKLGLSTHIFPPKKEEWYYYKRRNRKIAKDATKLYDIEPQVLREPNKQYPYSKKDRCVYRRSGGTWALEYARDKLNKPTELIVIKLKG